MKSKSPQNKLLIRMFRPRNILMLIVLVLIVYIIAITDFGQIIMHIKEMPPLIFVIMICLQLVTQFALNFQWYKLCKALNLKATFAQLLTVNAYGMVADAITPGEKVGGEVARVIQMNRILGYNTEQSTSVVTIQKSLSLTAFVFLNIIAVITLSGEISFLKSALTRIILIAVMVALAVFFIYILFFTKNLNAFIQRLRFDGRIARVIKAWVANFAKDTERISNNPKQWVFQLLLSFGIWGLFPLKLFILVSQSASVRILPLFAITFVSYFAAMIPLLPGGLGAFEGTMSGMLLAYGLMLDEAMAISLVFRFVTFWFVILFSLTVICFWRFSIFLKKRKKTAHENQ